MEKRIKIYWAGDLFDHKDLAGNLLLAEKVEFLSGGRYLPMLPQNGEVNKKRSLDIRDGDYDLLLSCDMYLGNFDGPDLDSGTVAEFLFAKMLDIPAVLLRTDFRCPAESSTSPDPWNLMCSGYPRTRSLILHSMQLWHEATEMAVEKGKIVDLYYANIAEKILKELDKCLVMEKVFSFEELAGIYRNTLRAAGGKLPEIWTEEKILALLAEKAEKGIY
ncbi:MAG: nucleoside 2-deoxyribosyltransferase [Lentisphaeria bacterium]|nr:nucleoside 2-deoxyribosyltransferase [Lentisphaeria bacterium]